MTLEDFFTLTRPPFPKAAPKSALFKHGSLEKVLNRLMWAIKRDTVACLIGHSGSGKSTALRTLIQTLDATQYRVMATAMTSLKSAGFLSHLLVLAGSPRSRFKDQSTAAFLANCRQSAKRTILLLDEAQLLHDESLEDLRLLTADNLDQASAFSLILVGQPSLRMRLLEPQHHSFWQRIGVRLSLNPLTEADIPQFIERHLKSAGCQKKGLFTDSAYTEIFQYSRGLPRLIQMISLEAMAVAMQMGKLPVDTQMVRQAIMDLDET